MLDLVMSDEDLQQFCLLEIDTYLRENGKCLDDVECMPKLLISNNGNFNNILLDNELRYDCGQMKVLHGQHFSNLNDDQLDLVRKIKDIGEQ
jgi:hypothetical protein